MTTYLKSWCVVLISLQLGSGFDPHSRLLQEVSRVFFRYHYSFYWSHRSLWRILWRQKTKDNFFGWAIVGSKCLVIRNWYQSHTPKPFDVAKLDSPEKYFCLFVFIFVHWSFISENAVLEPDITSTGTQPLFRVLWCIPATISAEGLDTWLLSH